MLLKFIQINNYSTYLLSPPKVLRLLFLLYLGLPVRPQTRLLELPVHHLHEELPQTLPAEQQQHGAEKGQRPKDVPETVFLARLKHLFPFKFKYLPCADSMAAPRARNAVTTQCRTIHGSSSQTLSLAMAISTRALVTSMKGTAKRTTCKRSRKY